MISGPGMCKITSQLSHIMKSLLVFAVVLLPVAAGANWPEFRGPTGQGRATAKSLPTSWSSTENIVWRRPIAGRGWSSPIIWGDRLFVTTAIEEPAQEEAGPSLSLCAMCIDARSGDLVWNRPVFVLARDSVAPIHGKNSYASPTPITDGERIYVHFGPHGTAALDFEGNEVWSRSDIRYNAQHGGGGSPILSGEALVMNCDGVDDPFVVALHRKHGTTMWRTSRPPTESHRFSFATPLAIEVSGAVQIVSPASHLACGYDAKTGRELWRVNYPNKWSVIPRPVFAGGKVFVCTGYEGPAELLAIDASGSGDVTDTHVVWRTDKYVSHTPSPVVSDGLLFMVSDEGIASCCDVATGKRHWHKRLGGNYSASPFLANGLVYAASEEGDFTVFRAATEYDEAARCSLGEAVFASMATDGEALYVRTDAAVYRIDDE